MTMQLVTVFFKIFLTFIILLDPLGNTPAFLSVAGAYEKKTQLHILREAIFIAGGTLLVFAIFGKFILNFFGITPGAFYIAGGIILFTIALDMIQSKPRSRHTPHSTLDPQETTMVAVFPLAIPLIAGPGMITTIMVYTASSSFSFTTFVMVLLALVVGLVIEYLVLRSATFLVKVIGTTGLFVLEKVMGLILAGMAVQFVYDGLVKIGVLAAATVL
jgi:multiple antibiotic resistance protein